MSLGGEAQYLINENRRMAEQRGFGGSGGDGPGGCFIWVAVSVIAIGLIIGGIVGGDSSSKTSETDATENQLTAKEEKDLGFDLTQEIKLTDKYAFALPEEAQETPDGVDTSDGFDNEKVFVWDDGNMVARSFIVTDEPECFPALPEYLYEGTGTELGYSTFFDTALATGKDETTDAGGEKMYRTAYFWPDGGDTLCCIEILGYEKDSRDYAKAILDSVKYNSLSQAAFMAKNLEYEDDVEIPGYYTPDNDDFRDSMVPDMMEEEYKRAMREEFEFDQGNQPF